MKIPRRLRAGFSLVETAMALGVISFSLVLIVGLLPIGFSSVRNSTVQTGAMNLITAIAVDIRATSTNATASPRFLINTASGTSQTLYFDEAATVSTSLQASSRYKALVQRVWQPSSSETVYRLTILWPPQASTAAQGGSVDVVVSLPQN